MNGYERRKHKKIEQVFEAAFQLFTRHGYQKVSVNEIAQQAGVSPATIYNYFGTKDQLYIDMIMNWMDKQLAKYDRILESDLPFPEKTKEIMLLEANNLTFLSEEFRRIQAFEDRGIDLKIRQESEQKIKGFFMKFVALGKQEGYIDKEQTEEVAMLFFTMFMNELGRRWDSANREFAISTESLMELFFYGLAGQHHGGEQR
ncbi:TetR/AcrR family transcriptional regulator [Paenibacillus lautus]|uniref:TetR/AcrR family transcriptional regulator n=1 Tax=Paenibacillus lautus TaxID=1401 RepID=A0A385TKN8_PAELA|nr:TetR/AcrR family transcriptional regulator [Paenibacillus lautus]AYB45050.1 TetR/AcrR family transcriptional regulator [Paenibacillus lautus]MBY0163868.1 TetR/AcrR family transcriptional regulator [Cytobacillus firmus]